MGVAFSSNQQSLSGWLVVLLNTHNSTTTESKTHRTYTCRTFSPKQRKFILAIPLHRTNTISSYMQSNPIATMAFPPNATWHDPDFGSCLGNATCIKTFGLRIYNSSYIYIYAAGLYSFFENYQTSICLANTDCQINAASIEISGYVYIYSLYTVGTWNQVLMDYSPLITYQSLINNTFGQSVAVFGYP